MSGHFNFISILLIIVKALSFYFNLVLVNPYATYTEGIRSMQFIDKG
jgi:uncharacterized membrane protein